MKFKLITTIFLMNISMAVAQNSDQEKRESFFKNCMNTTLESIQEAEQFKRYASKPYLLFAMSSCYCGRVASKFETKDAEEMVQKLKNKEKFDKKPKMLELYESSEVACKKALLD